MTVDPSKRFQIIILSATPGGITAALAAARNGYKALILERTPYIGGLPANGLGATDIATRGCGGGLFKEFVDRILHYYEDRYGKDSAQVVDCDSGYHFEPHAAEEVFHNMLEEQGNSITILRERQFDFEHENLCIEDGSIKSIRVFNRQTLAEEMYHGQVFVDASYEGDLIAAARVPFFVGREGREIYDEPGSGRVFKLWRGEECSGTTNMGDNAIQAYNYRLCLTNDGGNVAPFKRPPNYRREEYVSMIEDIKSGIHTCQVRPQRLTAAQLDENRQQTGNGLAPKHHDLPGIVRLCSNVRLPNQKVDANNQHLAFISTDLPEENWPYPTAPWEWRDVFALRQRHYTEGLLYFAQTDEEVPKWFRDEIRAWGWAADEYRDNGHFPRQLYVREGRRMKGRYIFTAHDSLPGKDGKPPLHKDSITASHYPLDSHAARKRERGRVHLGL